MRRHPILHLRSCGSPNRQGIGLFLKAELAIHLGQAFGGGAIFMGLDDGETDLTRPVDWSRVRARTALEDAIPNDSLYTRPFASLMSGPVDSYVPANHEPIMTFEAPAASASHSRDHDGVKPRQAR